MISTTTPSVSAADSRIQPTRWWTIALAGQIILHFVWPIHTFLSFPATLIGLVLVLPGTVITLWGDNLFKKHRTAIKVFDRSTTLVDYGPFAASRNPIYLGMELILLGVSVILGSAISLVGPIVFFAVVDRWYIPHEERAMEDTFGQEYTIYRSRVRRWL